MLYKLLKHGNKNQVVVVSMMSKGFYSQKINDLGIQVVHLNVDKSKNILTIWKTLNYHFKKSDIIQSWMYHSDFISFFMGKIVLRKKVIWGVRRSYLHRELMKSTTFYLAKINSYFSRYIDRVVSCSIVGKENHIAFGYSMKNMQVIANGFDVNTSDKNDFFRQEMNINTNTKILLNVARWEALKDHQTLLRASKKLKDKGINFNLVLVGKNMDLDNLDLIKEIRINDLEDCITLLGERDDIPYLMKASDFYISSSISEGFPNVIGEAMASSLYCIATDAGDTKYILGGNGSVVTPGNPVMLANEIFRATMLDDIEKQRLESLALSRVKTEFSIMKIVSEYEKLYENLMR